MMKYLKAIISGIRDGWREPLALSSSENLDHLVGEDDRWDVRNVGDWGINLGQFLHAGTRSESHIQYGFPLRRG